MAPRALFLACALALASACQTPAEFPDREVEIYQGFIAYTDFSEADITLDSSLDSTTSDNLSRFWSGGAAMQKPLLGEDLQFGFELGWTLGKENDESSIDVNNVGSFSTSTEAIMVDIFGGPYFNVFPSPAWRIYGTFGPMLQWGDIDLKYFDDVTDPDEDPMRVKYDDSGFGYGVYARTGAEIKMNSATAIGLSVRWVDAELSLGGDIEDFTTRGTQLMFTFSSGW